MAETVDFSLPLPELLDTQKVFRQALQLTGCVSVTAMPRLSAMLAATTGEARARLQFGFDEERRRRIDGKVEAEVTLICQRCLNPMSLSVSETVNLALVGSEEAARQLPVEIDPWLCTEDELSPTELVEEQLILGLPIVANHTECEGDAALEAIRARSAPQNNGKNVPENPFSVLAALKDRQTKH